MTDTLGQELEAVRELLTATEHAVSLAYQARDSLVQSLRDQGFTQAETGALLGITKQRVSQIERDGWGTAPLSTPAERLAAAREAYQAAKTAQKLREEAYAMGYKAETRVFYALPDTPVADEAEQPVRWKGFYEGAHAEAV